MTKNHKKRECRLVKNFLRKLEENCEKSSIYIHIYIYIYIII